MRFVLPELLRLGVFLGEGVISRVTGHVIFMSLT